MKRTGRQTLCRTFLPSEIRKGLELCFRYDQERDLPKDTYQLQKSFLVNTASNILKSDDLKKLYNKGMREFDKNNFDKVIDYIIVE